MNEESPLLISSSSSRKDSLGKSWWWWTTSPRSEAAAHTPQQSKGRPLVLDNMTELDTTTEPTGLSPLAGETIENHRDNIIDDSPEFSTDVDPDDEDDYDEDASDDDSNGNSGAGHSEPRPTPPQMTPFDDVNSPPPEKLGVVSMAVMVFYSVSGGPFGVETTVRAGGNLYALLGFLVLPFVWSLQEALMTAELGTAFPEASGGVVWVEEAFGPLAGWMSGYLSWFAGATDNAIYPVLFMDYLLQAIQSANGNGNGNGDDFPAISQVLRFCLLTSTTILLAYINWRGLALVGKMSVLICVVAMSPFVILVVVGSFKVSPSRWFLLPNNDDIDPASAALDDDMHTTGGFFPNFSLGGILWRPFLNNLFWNLNSFDSAGSLVAELDSTASFAKAMIMGVALVASCYFFPLLIAIGSSDAEQADWTDGYLAAINTQVVGPWLGAWTVFAAGISNIGLFQAELSSDAFQLMGMADRGYLPKIFRQRSKHGTPTYGLLLGTVVIVIMGVSDLDRLIEMLNFNYGFSLLFEYAAFFKLRISRPQLERPYRIPLSTGGCALVFFPTVAATILVMSLATYATYYFSLATWLSGYLLYAARKWSQPPEGSATHTNNYARVEGEDSFQDEEPETSVESEIADTGPDNE